MCAPLLTPDGQALGILQLDTTDRERFDEEDLDTPRRRRRPGRHLRPECLTASKASCTAERMERDLRLAEQVQRRFLPQSVPTYDGFEFYAHYLGHLQGRRRLLRLRAPLTPDKIGLALGDVAGKGIAAALMMAKFSGDTRFCILAEPSPAAAGDRLNDLLYNAGLDERFITLCLGVFDLTERTLHLHLRRPPAPPRSSRNGNVEEFGQDISGFPLGILPDSTYDETSITLEPGDVALIYSDGVTDGRNTRDEIYDTRENPRLKRKLATASAAPTPSAAPSSRTSASSPKASNRPTTSPSSPSDPSPKIALFACYYPSRFTPSDRSPLHAPEGLQPHPAFRRSPRKPCPSAWPDRLGVDRQDIKRWRILRKSLDARNHDEIHFVYSAEVELPDQAETDRRQPPGPRRRPLRPHPLRLARARP